jgi:two-component system, LytTR family, sensor kinase
MNILSNPILKSFKNFILYLIFWLLVSLIYFLLQIFLLEVKVQTAAADSLVFNLLLGGLGLSIWYPVKYIPFEKNNLAAVLFNHIIGGVIASAIWLSLGFFIINSLLNINNDYSQFFINTLAWRFLIGLLFYFLISSFYYIIIYYTGFQERIIKESELKNLVTAAELKSLKFQINPHFIFNSLNSMSALTTIDPEKAKSMILKLADFLRYTLANNEQQKNKLGEEINNLRLYLDIEKIRFEDKFEFSEEINEDCKNIVVPNMILQPLFENAIKHAVYETLDKVNLKLKCRKENNFLKITVENNFDSMSDGKKGAGVGLKNIADRLELIYGQKNLIEVKRTDNTFCVNLFIPLQEQT